MQLAVVQEQYLLHHGSLGHSPKTVSHYQDTFRSFDLNLVEKGHAPTTAVFTKPVINEFALWLRQTPTRGWRGKSNR